MRLRAFLTLALPLAFAALFVRLGIWQLSRLREKRAFNAVLTARFAAAPADITTLPADTALGHYRRVTAGGTMLYDREVVYAGRSHEGSPGVDLLTPLKLDGRDTVVMVNRGWAYSFDAASIDNSRWKEKDSVAISRLRGDVPGEGEERRAATACTRSIAPPSRRSWDFRWRRT